MITNTTLNVNTIDVVHTKSGHIFFDTTNSILNLKILNEKYNNTEFLTLCSTLKEFFHKAKVENKKFYLIFDVRNIGIYPLGCYEQVKKTLEELKNVIPHVLNSTCVIVNKNIVSQILKFFFGIYKPLRPAKIVNNELEVIDFFNTEYLT